MFIGVFWSLLGDSLEVEDGRLEIWEVVVVRKFRWCFELGSWEGARMGDA